MSDHQQYIRERDQIDILITKDYHIKSVEENLNGSIVEFVKNKPQEEENKREILYITTANARKYFAVKMIEQQASDM